MTLRVSEWRYQDREACKLELRARSLGDVVVLVPEIFQDGRGFFTETFRADQFKALGIAHSSLCKTTIRGLRKGSFVGCISNGNRPWAS